MPPAPGVKADCAFKDTNMTAVLVISLITIACMITVILVKPSVKIGKVNIGLYWVVALIGAVTLLAAGLIGFEGLGTGLFADSAVNPIKILTLFISMTVLSIFLDEAGFFKYLANAALRRAKSSQRRIFLYLYAVVSVLTIFTSNDIIVLTLTPFICYFAKSARVSPIPYLVCEFVAANTWSMMLIIGNPTNIYLASAYEVDFLSYLSVMAVPAVFAGLTALGVLYLLFRKALTAPISAAAEPVEIKSKPLLTVGLIHLVGCIALLTVASYIGIEMWIITLAFALSLFIVVLIYKAARRQQQVGLWLTVKRAPWELVPFILSMFTIVLALDKYGITAALGSLLAGDAAVWTFGAASALLANIVNNIPMSVLMGGVIANISSGQLAALYASVIGSNIGAYLTPVGALAGIMWMNLLKKHEVEFSFISFVKYGAAVAIPTLAAALASLQISLLWA